MGREGASGEESGAFHSLPSIMAFGWCVGRRLGMDLRMFGLESLHLGRLLPLQVEAEPSF